MATFFGEVLPVTSRAVDDDDDEDESVSEACVPFIRWSSSVQDSLTKHKLECNILIVAIGAAAVGFTETYIKHQDYQLAAGIMSDLKDRDPSTLMQSAPKNKTCCLYRSNTDNKIFICLCNVTVTVEQCYHWVIQLFSGLDAVNASVIVLNTLPTSCYNSDVPASDLPGPILRGLKTNEFDGTLSCPVLEQPNLVTGLAAQIMTHCQAHWIKAVLYQCYTKTRTLVDTATMKTFMPVLHLRLVRDIIKRNPDADKRINEIAEQHQVHDTLYL